MSLQPVSIPLLGGFDRSVGLQSSFQGGFYEMIGLRQSRLRYGVIEQTPRFATTARTAKDYYLAGTVTEAASTRVLGAWRQVFFTEQTVSTLAGTTVQVLYQSAIPANSTINGQCCLVVNSITGLALALGDTVDIEIDGAATFKWRKSGGAYTTLVPITTAGVSIDSGNATVYFLTATGFTIGNVWSWQRTDRMLDTSGSVAALNRGMSMVEHGGMLYFTNANRRVMVYDPTVGYVRSVGYSPIYGMQLKSVYDHLFVTNGVKDAIVVGSTVASSKVVYNSDLNDFDCFFSTDVNEADVHSFPFEGSATISSTATTPWAIGIGLIRNYVYVFTPRGVYYSAYVGLPVVFSFEPFSAFALELYSFYGEAVIQADNAVYILRDDGPWKFDGAQFTQVGRPLVVELAAGATEKVRESAPAFGCYDHVNREFHYVLDMGDYLGESPARTRHLYTFHEGHGLWHRRSVSFLRRVNSIFIYSTSAIAFRIALGAESLTWYDEDQLFSGTPVNDGSNGTTITIPTLTTQAVVGTGALQSQKEVNGARVAARVTTVTGSYATTANAALKVATVNADDGIPDGTATASENWLSATANAQLSLRSSFYAGAIRVQCLPVTGSFVAKITLRGLTINGSNFNTNLPTR